MLSEKRVKCKGLYAGTIDIVCGYEDFDCDIAFNEENHQYNDNGEDLVSVTQLLQDDCYEYVSKDVLEKAAKRGTEIHHEIEMYIKSGIKGTTHEFAEFMRIYLENEEIFNSKAVMDIKTYNTLSKEALQKVKLQTGLYVKALRETIGDYESTIDTYVIWLPKDKKGKLIKI